MTTNFDFWFDDFYEIWQWFILVHPRARILRNLFYSTMVLYTSSPRQFKKNTRIDSVVSRLFHAHILKFKILIIGELCTRIFKSHSKFWPSIRLHMLFISHDFNIICDESDFINEFFDFVITIEILKSFNLCCCASGSLSRKFETEANNRMNEIVQCFKLYFFLRIELWGLKFKKYFDHTHLFIARTSINTRIKWIK